ncbi:MAG: pyridoxal phosphate-dependent decarboxylase family protein [Actinomycetota bacterium]
MAAREIPSGTPVDAVLERLEQMRTNDVRWREGRAFSLAYSAGPEVLALAEEAYRRFSGENALNMAAFPSLRRMHQEVVDVVAGWVHGDDAVAGFMTSGGTESLVLVVRSATKRMMREGRSPATPNMVMPVSAHAALEKGADYFGVEVRRTPVSADWRADVDAMADAIDDDTILVVGSAPQYPQGVVDPITEIAALAAARDINCHVDACMGGVVLPALERLGEPFPRWDFRVEGVTSISVDLHKYGYVSKGSGVLLHRNKSLRSDQTFMTDNWLGGAYGSSGVLGTKSGGPIASSWAVLHHLGNDGYDRLARSARDAALRIARHVESHPALALRALPQSTLFSFGTVDPIRHDVFAIADEILAAGWYVDRQGPPASIHLTVNAVHEPLVDQFCSVLDAAVTRAAETSAKGGDAAYATTD